MRFCYRVLLFLGCSFFSVGLAAVDFDIEIQNWQTRTGVPVYFVESAELPMVDVKIAFAAGAAYDGSQWGLANFVGTIVPDSMVESARKTMSASEAFEKIGAQISVSVNQDMAVISLRTLTEPDKLEYAHKVLAHLLKHPAFALSDVNRVRQQLYTQLHEQEQSASEVATNAIYHMLYAQHPYGHDVLGTLQTLRQITLQDIENFFRRYYIRENAALVIVGAISRPDAEALAESLSAALLSNKRVKKVPLASSPLAQQQSLKFASEQSAIRVAQLGIDRFDKDYFPLVVGNHILGGNTLLSRLGVEIREKRGLVYNVASYFEPLQAKGPFLVTLETRQSESAHALQLVLQVLNQFITTGPTEAELTSAKQYLIGSFPLRIDNNQGIASYLVIMGFYGLPLNYLATYPQKVAQVTPTQIKAAFQRKYQNAPWLIVQTRQPSLTK